jgi:hypothetical protein
MIGPVPEYDAPLPMLMALEINRRELALPDRHLLSGGDSMDRLRQAKADEWHT